MYRVYVTKASNWNYEKIIYMDTLADLLKFMKESKYGLILEEADSDFEKKLGRHDFCITIYDSYVE